MIETNNIQDKINEIVEEITKQQELATQKLIIDDILDIYNGYFSNYDFFTNLYLKRMEHRREMIEKSRDITKQEFTDGSAILSYKYYPEPRLLEEEIFNYIRDKGLEQRKMIASNDLQNVAYKGTEPSCVVSWKQVGEMSGDCTCSYDIGLKPNTTLKEFVDYVLSKKSERGYLRLFGTCSVEYRGGEIIGDNLLLPFYDRKIKKAKGNGGYSCMDYFITLEE